MDLSWRIGGEAGYGISTAGYLFSKFCKHHGFYVFGNREYPSLIRGGHNTYTIRFSDKPINSQRKYCDILLALNERAIKEEFNYLSDKGYLIYDKSITPYSREGIKLIPAPLYEITSKHENSKFMINTLGLGITAGLLGFNKKKCLDIIRNHFKKKHKDVKTNVSLFNEGYLIGEKNKIKLKFKRPKKNILINGNVAFAIGAIRAGCNFISAYPMTPATGIEEYLTLKAKDYGICAVQAEDEISAINNALGASFAGARAMTCTSGGGFALMNETISLAGMSETPIVIVLAQRTGPATGLPTRTSQSDLNFAINAGHGEFSKIVLAPGDVNECYEDALNAFNYAEKYQTPVIVLLDKHLSTSVKTVPPFKDNYKIDRGKLVLKGKVQNLHRYKRYEYTKDGVSPRPIPGGPVFCSIGDEHDEEGFIIESSEKRIAIALKRKRKDELIKKDLLNKKAINVFGKGDITIIGWGSTKGAILEAIKGKKIKFIQVRLLNPFPGKLIKKYISGKVLVVENNRDGQITKLLEQAGIHDFNQFNKFDGRPIHPEEIEEVLNEI